MYLRPLSRRDCLLVFLGGCSMYIWFLFFDHPRQHAVLLSTTPADLRYNEQEGDGTRNTHTVTRMVTRTTTAPPESTRDPDSAKVPPDPLTSLPPTTIVAHTPGWTLFKNLYMANGTLLLVSSSSSNSFPPIHLMTSSGQPIENTPENIAGRMPKAEHMDFITPEQADTRWKVPGTETSTYRVWSVKGNTILFNDDRQFLHHYFHFVAELFFGMWAFWYGAFTKSSSGNALSLSYYSDNASVPPSIHRIIFAHTHADGWHDNPAVNAYFLRAILPYVTVEDQQAWQDRVLATVPSDPASNRAWHFPYLMLIDRTASFYGHSQARRIAAEAWEHMFAKKQLLGVHAARWWDPLREAVWRFAGVTTPDAVKWMKLSSLARKGISIASDSDQLVTMPLVREGAFQRLLPAPQKITITYISRQLGPRRRLADESHIDLVMAISELVTRRRRKGEEWEFKLVNAQQLSKDKQIRIVAETTIMLGVHGNGLSHLVFMPPTKLSTVIEIFQPGGFANDYQWTATAMGMKHYGVWNDTHFTLPKEPGVNFPPGFQGTSIPVHGPSVAKLIEDRVDGRI